MIDKKGQLERQPKRGVSLRAPPHKLLCLVSLITLVLSGEILARKHRHSKKPTELSIERAEHNELLPFIFEEISNPKNNFNPHDNKNSRHLQRRGGRRSRTRSSSSSSSSIWANSVSGQTHTGGFDTDDWHNGMSHERGSSSDAWTGDMDDFLHSEENDRHHSEPVLSLDDDGHTIWDDVFERNERRHEVAVDYSWITWAEEDVDFWIWFWEWYENLDEAWSFDHEPGTIVRDPEYEWDWLQEHTAGHNLTHDALVIDYDDSEQWSEAAWDKHWREHNQADLAEDGFMRHADGTQERLDHNEDTLCAPGTFLNTQQTCMPCPVGCTDCSELGHCFACADKWEPVQGPTFGFCFPKCFHGMYRQTFYEDEFLFKLHFGLSEFEDVKFVMSPHAMLNSCMDCPANCRGCAAAPDGEPFCYECMHGFKFDKNDTCIEDPLWQQSESQITVRAIKQKIAVCDKVRVRVDEEKGYYDAAQKLQDVQWSVQFSDEGSEETRKELEMAIQGLHGFEIEAEITKRLEIGQKVTFEASAWDKDKTKRITDSETIEIAYPAHPSLAGFETTYYILHAEGLRINMQKSYKQCHDDTHPTVPFTNEDYSRLNCTLLDSQRKFITSVDRCDIGPNQLDSGKHYFLELNWQPHTEAFKNEKRHIRVITQTEKAYCTFESGDSAIWDPQEEHTLDPSIFAFSATVNHTAWTCDVNPNRRIADRDLPTSSCSPELYELLFPDGKNSMLEKGEDVLNVPATSSDLLRPGNHYIFTHLLYGNEGQYVTNCTFTASIKEKESTYESTLEVRIKDLAPPIGFLNIHEPHVFFCEAMEESGSPFGGINMNYEMQFSLLSKHPKENFPGYTLSEFSTQKQSLTLSVEALPDLFNREFELVCKVTNEENNSYGEVRKTYNTYEYDEEFDFLVNLVEGQAYQTEFQILVQKPEAELLMCKFGYFNRLGKVYIEDVSEVATRYSSQDQFVLTTLPLPDNGSTLLPLFAQCEDVLGQVKTKIQEVEILANENSLFDASETLSGQISDSLEQDSEARTSDIVALTEAITNSPDKYVDDAEDLENTILTTRTEKIKTQLSTVMRAIATKEVISSDETRQLTQAIASLWQQVKKDEKLKEDRQLSDQLMIAMGNVIDPKRGARLVDDSVENGAEYSIMDVATFNSLRSTLDEIVTSSTERKENKLSTDDASYLMDLFFESGVNRVAESLDSSDPRESKSYFNGKTYDLAIQKKSQEDFIKDGFQVKLVTSHESFKGMDSIQGGKRLLKSQVEPPKSLGLAQSFKVIGQVKVKIPFDPLFRQESDILFATSHSALQYERGDLMEMHSDAITSAVMLSGIVNISARTSQQTSVNSSRASEIKVKDLIRPVEIDIPINQDALKEVLDQDSDYKVQCMYLDEETNLWQKLESHCNIVDQIIHQKGSMKCCSSHLTQFSVQAVKLDTNLSILTSTLVPTKLTSRAVTSLTLTNIVFVVLIVLGFILDFKKVLQFRPSYKQDGEEGGKAEMKNESQQIPNDSILDNTVGLNRKGTSPIQGLEMKQMKYAIGTPDDQQEDAEEEKKSESLGTGREQNEEEKKGQEDVADLQDVKFQMDDVVGFETGSELKQAQQVQDQQDKVEDQVLGHRSSVSSLKMSTQSLELHSSTSSLDLEKAKTKLKAELSSQILTKNIPFKKLYCNAILFYHRILSIVYTHNSNQSRALKALNFATQCLLTGTIVASMLVFRPEMEESLGLVDYIGIFLSMRLISFLLGLGLIREQSTSKVFALMTTLILAVIFLIANFVLFSTLQVETQEKQEQIINGWLIVLCIEFILWDTLLMPLFLALLARISQRTLLRFDGLRV